MARCRTLRMAIALLAVAFAACLALTTGCSSGSSNATGGSGESGKAITSADANQSSYSSSGSEATTTKEEPPANNRLLAKIISADGAILAESHETPNGSFLRSYPLADRASLVIGSRYTVDAPEGIEQRFEDALAAGQDVHLTIDSRIQNAAAEALDGRIGAIVVLDPNTGAVLAMASTPSYDPESGAADGESSINRATELHVPGSTFKTITLAAALESGVVSPNEKIDGPAELVFADGSISNYDHEQHLRISLPQAYAQSVNTAFAQIALQIGAQSITDMAHHLGFDANLMDDFNLPASTVNGVSDEDAHALALTGIGQAQFREDGTITGPLMTPVQGAVIASAVANGGTAFRPYLVESVGDTPTDAAVSPEPLIDRAFSTEVAAFISEAMLDVVSMGTGTSAAVPGVTVGGKTGTAETISGNDDGWFIGFAERGEEKCAFSVLVVGSESAEATKVASHLIGSLFE